MKIRFIYFIVIFFTQLFPQNTIANTLQDKFIIIDSLNLSQNYDSALVECYLLLENIQESKGEVDTTVIKIRIKIIHNLIDNGSYETAITECNSTIEYIELNFTNRQKDIYECLFLKALSMNFIFKYKESLELVNSILEPCMALFSSENIILAKLYSLIGSNNKSLGNYLEAEESYTKQLEILNLQAEKNTDEIFYNTLNLANMYEELAKYSKAEQLYKTAINEKQDLSLQYDSQTLLLLRRLAGLSFGLGKNRQADSLYEKLIRLGEIEKDAIKDSTRLATSLTFAAFFYTDQKEYKKAESYLRRSLNISIVEHGKDHPAVADILNRLGYLYIKLKKYTEAEQFLLRSLEIRRDTYSADHIYISHSLNRLGLLNQMLQKYDQAEKYFNESLRIREKTLRPFHPYIIESYKNLSRLFVNSQNSKKSIEFYKKVNETIKIFFENVFYSATESQKLRWIQKYPPIDNSLLSYALILNSEETTDLAYNMILHGKSAVLDALMVEKEILLCSYDDIILEKYNERNEVRTTIANEILGKGNHQDNILNIENIKALINLQDSLESNLSQMCSNFADRITQKKLNIDKLKYLLPDSAVYWEFVRYTPFNFYENEYSVDSARYLAFVLQKSYQTEIVDLGKASEIDSLIIASRELIYKAQSDIYFSQITTSEKAITKVNAQLYEKLFKPLIINSQGKSEIYICPDGMISLLPFNILPSRGDSYIIEDYQINYITSANDFIENTNNNVQNNNIAILIADPAYDYVNQDNFIDEETDSIIPDPLFFGPSRGVEECLENEFSRLRFSRKEAVKIADILKKDSDISVNEFYGIEATESLIKEIGNPPKILHIATHGFYCDSYTDEIYENPLLKSCLALAGANSVVNGTLDAQENEEDGILTAYEVMNLNLTGTELVTLSACESALGEFLYDKGIQGEGVFGLRRALRHAGAKSILMSLWKTPDKQTSEFMELFYKHWLGGAKKSDAIRNAMLDMMKQAKINKNSTHPFLWGGFILSGNIK